VAFATEADVAKRFGRELSDGEKGMAEALIEAAEAMIAEAVERDDEWATALDPVPKVLKFVAVEIAARGMANPTALSSLQEQLGSHQYTETFRRSAEGAGILLSNQERDLVRRTVLGSQVLSMRTPRPDPCFGS
jgi:hypothetical protein